MFPPEGWFLIALDRNTTRGLASTIERVNKLSLFFIKHLTTCFNFKLNIMENTQVLFDEIELLNQQIEELEQEQRKLQARRQLFQNYVERLVSQAEDQMNEGGY